MSGVVFATEESYGEDEPEDNHSERLHTIGFWAGICLLANNVTGPGMVDIPGTFQNAGWLFPTIAFVFTAVYSSLVCLFLARALSNAKGNGRFQKQFEFSNLAHLIFPRWLYVLIVVALVFTFQCTNISAIVESAQTMDSTLLAVFKKTCGLTIYSPDGKYYRAFEATGCPNHAPPHKIVSQWHHQSDHGLSDMYGICNATVRGVYQPGSQQYGACCGTHNCSTALLNCTLQTNWPKFESSPVGRCIGKDSNMIITDSPFGTDYVLSIGYMIVLIITIPVGFYDLESSMWVQVGGFLLLVFCCIAWIVQFLVFGLESSNMPLTNQAGAGSVLSDVMFNFGFVVTIPSWLNEKKRSVGVAKSIWGSVAIGSVMFLSLGIFGAISNIDFSEQDLLAAVTTNPNAGWYSTVAAYIFPPAALLTGIPVVSIIIRYNLVESKICNRFWANQFAVVLPWIVSLFFYAGNFLKVLINWSSAVLFVILNFLFPLCAYLLLKPSPESLNESLVDDYSHEIPGDYMGQLKEMITIIPYGYEWLCCRLREESIVKLMILIAVGLAVATLSLQILNDA